MCPLSTDGAILIFNLIKIVNIMYNKWLKYIAEYSDKQSPRTDRGDRPIQHGQRLLDI